jgi:hypothetical protein
MKRSVEYYQNRIDILKARDDVTNKHIIAKLERIIRNYDSCAKA